MGSPLNSHKEHYYRWQGRDKSGKYHSGILLALHENDVHQQLQQQDIRLIKLRPCARPFLTHFSQRVHSRDITLFTRQLATMLNSGISMLEAFQIVYEHQKNQAMKGILQKVMRQIETGTPLSEALSSLPTHFDRIYIELVANAELSGQVNAVFLRLASYRENSDQLRSKIVKALMYPSVVIAAALLVTYLILTFVIPEFEAMFRGFGAQLPWFTHQVILLSEYVRQTGWLLMGSALVTLVIGNWVRRHNVTLRYSSHRLILWFPFLGPLLRWAALARLCRTIATSLSAGIPILQSVQAGSRTCGNLHYQYLAECLCQDTAAGLPLYQSLRRQNDFPEWMIQMVMIGEQTGRLDEMLNKVADFYENEVENRVDNIGQLIEPLLILLLGGLVGGLVIAMYLPIFNLMSVLG